MFVPQEALNKAHPTLAMCRSGRDRKRRSLVVSETEEQMGRLLSAYGTPLTAVTLFRYFGRTLSSSEDDWPAVEQNLRRAREKW